MIWDTAGQEKYKSLGSTFYNGSECCFIVYDITDSRTFEDAIGWRSEFLSISNAKDPSCFPFILLGNKCDKKDMRKVVKEKGETWAAKHNAEFFETSAKDLIQVEEAFMKAVHLVLEYREKLKDFNKGKKENQKLTKAKIEDKNKGCEC